MPECGNIQTYPGMGLCDRCYKIQWFQTHKMHRRSDCAWVENAVKVLTEKAIMRLRESFENNRARYFRYSNQIKVPRSNFVVEIKITRQPDHRDDAAESLDIQL